MRTDQHGLTQRDRLALEAAKLYFTHGMSQQEVADLLHVSRPNVSKLIRTARARGFVRTHVVDPRASDAALISALRRKYDLVETRLVVPVGRGAMGAHRALGVAAAELISHAGPDDVVGFWWSDTMQAVARSIVSMQLTLRALVQLNGIEPVGSVSPLLSAFAEQAATPVHLYPQPIVHTSLAGRLDAAIESESRQVTALQTECDLVIFGAQTPADAELLRSPAITDVERAQLEQDSVGHICGRFIDSEGRIVAPSLSQRTLGPTLSDLRKTKRTVLVAAGGEVVPVMRAALTNRYANHLVTDVDTAYALLG